MSKDERQKLIDLLAYFSILEIGFYGDYQDPAQVHFHCQGLRDRVKQSCKDLSILDSELQLAIKELM